MSRRLLAAGLAAATVTAGVALAPGAGADELPPLSDSPLVLQAPKNMKVKSHGGWVYNGLKINLIAQHEDFRVDAHRYSWDQPIEAEWKRESGDQALPAGAMSSWQGLDAFTRVRFTPADGTGKTRRIKMTGCFNNYTQERVDPRGPIRSDYPYACPWNPFTKGSVMGIAEGYRSPLWSDWNGAGLRLRPGSYTVRASIAPQWREFFGISREDAIATSTLTVVKGRDWGRSGRTGTRQAAADSRDALQPAATEPTADAGGAMSNEFAPDLQSLPAIGIGLNGKGTALRFGATVWNGGNGPMVVDGFRSADADHMDAYQYFLDDNGDQAGYQRVGEMHWHAANHNHWHFEDFARYRLLAGDENGPVEGPAIRSNKRSFCLANTDAVDYTVPNADWRPDGTDLSTACGGRRALSVREVLSNGSGDTYYQFRAGQAFRVGNLPDGIYYISVEANPDDRDGRNLVELSYDNNDSLRKIVLTHNRRGERVVRVPQVGIIDEMQGGFFRR